MNACIIYILRSISLQASISLNISIYTFMRNNLNWFESPFPKASTYNHLPIYEGDPEADNEEFRWRMVDSEALQSNFKCHPPNPLSPWSNYLKQPEEKREQPIEIPQFRPSMEQHKFVFSDEEQDEPVTPIRSRQVLGKGEHEQGEQHTTGKKSEEEAGQQGKKSKPREKGLRKLSQRAFEIVRQMKNVTYKQVAAKLVQQYNQDQFQSENKQQQNIKRRVYDALNVLIALGVLHKDGRKIVSSQRARQLKTKQSTEKQLEQLKLKVECKNKAVECKRKEKEQAVEKFNEVAFFFQRNKQKSDKHDEKVSFPFVGAFCDRIEEIKTTDYLFQFKSKTFLKPFGDMDCLKFFMECSESSKDKEEGHF